MEAIQISLIDLTGVAEHSTFKQLRELFEADHAVRVHQMRRNEQWLVPTVADSTIYSGNRPDIFFILLPDAITEIERGFIRRIGTLSERLPIIAVIQEAVTAEILELFRLGVTDFIMPPFKPSGVMPRVWRLAEHVRKKKTLVESVKQTIGLKQMIGKSRAFIAELQKIPFMASCDSTVLINGETGTGKEMFARAVHYLGPRAGRPFIPVNCGAIPAELIENELFGHARGAFTSAVTAQNGIISEADGGTLLLDEIDCLPLSAQVKLLRFLQEKEYRQLGSTKTQRADVRIITATNLDLGLAVTQGKFRRDLYYRLNIIPLVLPPLRERREDIPILAKHFIDEFAQEFSKQAHEIEPDAMQKLLLYDWPGNVRELQNVIERAVVFSSDHTLRMHDINLPQTETATTVESFHEAKAKVIIQFEKKYIHSLLLAHHGNITHAAKTAGKNRRAFWELMRKYEIDTGQYRHAN